MTQLKLTLFQLLLNWFWPNFKGTFLGPYLRDASTCNPCKIKNRLLWFPKMADGCENGLLVAPNNMRAAGNIILESERISETRKWKFCSANEDLIQRCHLQNVLIVLVDIRHPTWSGIILISDEILIYLKAWINNICWDAFINDLLGHVGINQHHHHHLSELTHPGVDNIVTQHPSSYQLSLLTLASIAQSLTKLKNCSAWPIPSLFGTISHNILKSSLKNNPLDKTK